MKKRIKIVLIVIVSISLFSISCSKKHEFNTSSIIPAARGEVAVKKDNNKNYRITIKLSYLAEPNRLNPAKTTYVVWQVSDENKTINLGQIISTSKLHVTFETVSSSKTKVIFITAEDDGNTQYPGNMKVLETDRF